MTKKELREHCKKQVRECERWAHSRGEKPSGKVYEEHKLILELLKQEPCDDCVSRQAVLDKAWDVSYEGTYVQVVDVGDIEELPPVTPIKCIATVKFSKEDMQEMVNEKMKDIVAERKKGKWICVHHIENKITYDSWKCSECQHDFDSDEESVVDFDEYKFCPNCGAEMESEE